MRIRLPFAGAFVILVLTTAYVGLSSLHVPAVINDKALHGLTFFALTTCFYWILDTTRRRNLNLTLLVCTGVLGIGSEFLQSFIPNGRTFDLFDIVANLIGSLAAVALCSWYHKRMLERKRAAKQYLAVPGNDDADLELGEPVRAQESGTAIPPSTRSLEEEVDTWDENLEDNWDEDGPAGTDSPEGKGPKTPSASSAEDADHQLDGRKRAD